ncbi:hypothetical protein THAOC_34875 [Thalassiosira oceanica]|uniref:Phosphoglycerate mutase (2,3-diphosphoglycerate-dependent) n=1 Tax=Thalassiosira oceanica TaxID=159749 RepID=K0R4A0_THAOC|nr:hypothetical protein THAOC_34875 [Thalassiosira oceanica]|eukprot:EJK46459.1 hypothetical protein THAOC_34875 [Thalassiosira oceanica]
MAKVLQVCGAYWNKGVGAAVTGESKACSTFLGRSDTSDIPQPCRFSSTTTGVCPPSKTEDEKDRPRRIILMRHGQSQGNVDEAAYVSTADWRIRLTNKGHLQAQQAGRLLRERIPEDERIAFYYSPYMRTKETLDEVMSNFDSHRIISCLEEPRISEQQIGNFQNVDEVIEAKRERSRFGRFYYRFPTGEAGLDVYSRVSSFIPTLIRDCIRHRESGVDLDKLNVVNYPRSVDDFEQSRNPENCELITLNKTCDNLGHIWMELDDGDRRSLDLPDACGIPRNVRLYQLHGKDEKEHGS